MVIYLYLKRSVMGADFSINNVNIQCLRRMDYLPQPSDSAGAALRGPEANAAS